MNVRRHLHYLSFFILLNRNIISLSVYLYFLWMKREQEKYFTTNRKDRCLSFLIVVYNLLIIRGHFSTRDGDGNFVSEVKPPEVFPSESSVTPPISFSVLPSLKVKHHIVALQTLKCLFCNRTPIQ